MPKRKPSPDLNPAIVDAVNRATGSEPVKGEDLLPPELAEQYRAAKPEDFRPISREAMGKSLQNIKVPPKKGK